MARRKQYKDYTEPPWFIEEGDNINKIIDSNEHLICEVARRIDYDEDDGSEEEKETLNSKIIATAPIMYETLIILREEAKKGRLGNSLEAYKAIIHAINCVEEKK